MSAIRQLLTEHIDIWTAADTEKKSGRGRSSGNAASVYGIKKLRELILELAVRGKLVPQDPNDEPASELLRHISFEKAKLIKNGTIKKQKIQPPITEDEKSFEIPDSWEWVRLDNISPMSLVDGDWIESKDQDPDGGIRLVQLADIGAGEFKDKSDRFINPETFEKLNCTQLQIGDILIARLPSPIGRACLFPESNQIAITVVDVAILRPLGMFCDEYVVNAINSKTFRDQVEAFGKGATRFRIATGNLKSLLIPIPPIEEQHRIVAKVDELMALCDQLETQHSNATKAHEKLVNHLLGTLTQSPNTASLLCKRGGGGDLDWQRIAAHFDTLFTTEASIDALKQTLLQLAVMGKLVPQDPNDEPAGELLKRIQAEKAKLVAEGKIKKEKLFSLIGEQEKSSKLPFGWAFAYMQDITKVITCGMASTPVYHDSGKIFLSAKNVKPYKFMPEDHKFVDEETFRKITQNAKPEKGDILLTRVGAGIGEAAIINMDIEFAFYVSLTLIKPFLEHLDSNYLLHWLNSPEGVQRSLDNIYGGGVSQGNLNVNQVRCFEIPIPPLTEQHRIVAKVDELMAICDQLKSRIAEANQLQQKLADVVVEQAISQ